MELDKDFTYSTLKLTPDYEGEVVATLISSKRNKGNRKSVLYIHGYIDYFFHPHMAEEFNDNSFDFYALDLRKCGRSILKHQRPYYIELIEEYFEDINTAINNIQKEKEQPIYLLGHSTGGLTIAAYCNSTVKHKSIKGLVLISPFLDMPQPTVVTEIVYPLIKLIVKVKPNTRVNGVVSSIYVRSIHKDFKGEWDFNTNFKPVKGFPTYFKWIIAIREAQLSLRKRKISIPILVLHASKSTQPLRYSKNAMVSDTVLDVNDMKRIGPSIGNKVSLIEIKDAMHDVFLSQKNIREHSFKELFEWFKSLEKEG